MKGKGVMKTYWLLGEKSSSLAITNSDIYFTSSVPIDSNANLAFADKPLNQTRLNSPEQMSPQLQTLPRFCDQIPWPLASKEHQQCCVADPMMTNPPPSQIKQTTLLEHLTSAHRFQSCHQITVLYRDFSDHCDGPKVFHQWFSYLPVITCQMCVSMYLTQ